VQQLRRLWGQFDAADRRDPQVAARTAHRAVQLDAGEDARLWLRPFWDRLSELAREDREQIALALLEARAGIGVDWLPRMESAAQAFSHEAPWSPRWAWSTPNASSGARPAACWSRPPPRPACRPAPAAPRGGSWPHWRARR
jgi:hypothetical protein